MHLLYTLRFSSRKIPQGSMKEVCRLLVCSATHAAEEKRRFCLQKVLVGTGRYENNLAIWVQMVPNIPVAEMKATIRNWEFRKGKYSI